MAECNQCGECCRYMILGRIMNSPKEEKEYLRARGAIESQGFWLIPYQCPHLMPTEHQGKFICIIHDHKPKVCAEWTGKRYHNHKLYWVPESCSLKVK